jgi:polysaccharide deacetylase 2 family uncharacterized protein YibQ
MFAKKPQIAAVSSRPSGLEQTVARARAAALTPLNNPLAGAAVAGLLLIGSAMTLVAVAGDPKAGSPSVRIALGGIEMSAAAPAGWREAQAQGQGAGQVTTDTFTLYETAPPVASDAAPIGQAVITMPGGAGGAGGGALATAPIAGLTEPGPGGGLLPVIAADGRTAAQTYARPFVSNGKPKVAVVIGGLGLNPRFTREAIEQLPAEITLSFVPSRDDLQSWIDLARAHGHEVLLEAPMEPLDYPDNDPGPLTLLAAGQPQETTKRTEWLLSRVVGYFGLTNYMGSRFVTSDVGMTAFLQTLRARGVAFIDDGLAARRGGGIPRASADKVIDDQLEGPAIDRRLAELEAMAQKRGQALGSGFSYPVTLSQVTAWTQGLEQRGFQLAPASALMIRR